MRDAHLDFFYLLTCLVDVVRDFDHPLNLDVLFLTGLDNALHLFYLNNFNYPVYRDLLHYFFTLV